MKKFLNQKVTKLQVIISAIGLFILISVMICFVVMDFLLNGFMAEDYCSSQAGIASKARQEFGSAEVEECMNEYKQTH